MTETTDPDEPLDERPAHARSPLWDHRARIEKMLEARYSYEQIARALKRAGVAISASGIGKWCRRRGLHSAAPSRHRPSGGDKKSAPRSSAAAAPAPAPASPSLAASSPSLRELLVQEERERAALADQFFNPRSKT